MSGIAGILNLDGQPVEPPLLKRMTDALAHRGPDGVGHWVDGPTGLGHRLLHTTPASLHETQPFLSEDGNLVIVADARIDNRDELNAALASPLRTDTDAELILNAYDRWGVDGPAHLIGDFAFAIWDRRHHRLFCARDPLGAKPLYYRWDGRRLRIASSLASMLADPSVPKHPNESFLADYLLMEFTDPGATAFEGVFQLPPAHQLQLTQGRLTLQPYWELRSDPAPRPRSGEEAIDQFRDLFREAVRCRMAGTGPLGILLSGGIDSTTVAAMAETLRGEVPVPPDRLAFTVLLDGFLQEEWEALQALGRRFGTPLQTIRLSDVDESKTCFEWFLDTGDTPHYEHFFTLPVVLERAAANGCRALLTGFGADELSQFAEQGFVKDALLSGHLRRFAREYASWRLAYGSPPGVWAGAWPLLWSELPSLARRLVKQATGHQVPRWIDRGFAKRTRLMFRSGPAVRPKGASRCAAESIWALTRPAMGLALSTLHAMSARFSVECRHPYLDRRLIEWFVALPTDIKMAFGYRKQFVQQALRSLLPVRGPEPLQELIPWTNGDDPASHRREATRLIRFLSQKNGRVFEYVDRQAIQRLLERFAQGQAPASARNILWNIAKLEVWLQRWGG
ncbi:MAG: hypothetical protein HY596_00765 [Candidatus Omnitrophica bacterium]|nr:hypothetical protein [Candidatus Omnitrophota bacterium]